VDEPSPRFWQVFFEVFEAPPRQGPGNRACASRALALCEDLPPEPAVVDLGCGAGGQTLYLAELTDGTITAIDRHAPFIERLGDTVARRGLAHRIRPIVGDIARPDLPPESFDLVWSEGALYNIGIPHALQTCRSLLRPGGYVAFTDAVWRTEDPPAEVKAGFDQDYPAMGRSSDIVAAIARSGLELLGHFTLPDEAWWDDFYTPMERRIAELREAHRGDAESLAALDQIADEPRMHRQHGECYAYEFFVARRVRGGRGEERERHGAP
jgi:SAM-dependent methyltransferase